MKNYFFAFIFASCFSGLNAQSLNLDTLVMPITDPHEDFGEYLVQLAWLNNPENKTAYADVAIAEHEVKIAKWDWAEDISASFNFNERNLQREQSFIPYTIPDELRNPTISIDQAQVEVPAPAVTLFPLFNITAAVRLGTFINNPKKTEIARLKLDIENNDLVQQKIDVRAEVLAAYFSYLQRIEMLKVKTQSVEDLDAAYKYVSNLFKMGEVPFEQFNMASSNLLRSRESLIQAETDARLSKLELEMLIGMSLENARKYHNRSR